VKLAPTWTPGATVTAQVVAVPWQAPDQPAKAEPSDAWAVSVTVVPDGRTFEQVPGQLMPVTLS